MLFLLNNCRGRRHSVLYGAASAFYDLNCTSRQGQAARNIKAGDECVVATREGSAADVHFRWFRFSHEERRPDPNDGVEYRVFFGERMRSETLDKAEATETEPYSDFFNINGHFKQMSVIESKRGTR